MYSLLTLQYSPKYNDAGQIQLILFLSHESHDLVKKERANNVIIHQSQDMFKVYTNKYVVNMIDIASYKYKVIRWYE